MDQNSNQITNKDTTSRFRGVRRLLIVYAAVAWLGFVTTILLSATVAKHHTDLVSTTAWIHSMVVALTGIPFISVAGKAAQSKGRAAMRLRIILTVVPIAFIADIFLLSLPTWMDVEQVICAVVLGAAAAVYFTRK